MRTEDIARIVHEANRAYCYTIGDNSQPTWDDAPDWQKQSAINGVVFHHDNPSAGPSASHEDWLTKKIKDGWKYGLVKNPDTKEHPCCVPYDQLPEDQKKKDALFVAIVKSLM